MGFDVNVDIIAYTFPAILLLVGAFLYTTGSQALGFLLIIFAIAIYVVEIILKHEDKGGL